MKLNINNWKEFEIKEILSRVPVKSISKILKRFPKGNVCVVGNSGENNGIIGYIQITDKDKKYIHPGNTLSYGAKGGKFFFQKNEWVSTDHVHMFWNKNLNEINQSFICTILNKLLESKGGWCSSLESNIVNEKILLPVDKNGNPDWEYMEQYIKELRERERESYELAESLINENIVIHINSFKQFQIGDLFNISRGKRIVKNIDYISERSNTHIYPTITATTINNGIDGFYDKYNCDGEFIVCGGEASGMYSTYHCGKVWVMDRARILKPKFIFNKYIAFYFLPLLNANMIKFSYGLSANPNDIGKINLLLPVNKDGNPDWEYMENYIKSLPYSKYL